MQRQCRQNDPLRYEKRGKKHEQTLLLKEKLELFKGEDKNSPLLIIFYFLNKTERVILAKNPTWRLIRGVAPPPPPIMKKYKIVRGNTLKFRSLVVETAFLGYWRGAFWKNTTFAHFMGWEQSNIGKNHYLTTYQGGGPPPIIKKNKILGGNTLKFRTLVVETAFLRKLEGAFWINKK